MYRLAVVVFLALIVCVWAEIQPYSGSVRPHELGFICAMKNVQYLNASVEVVNGQISGVYVTPRSLTNVTSTGYLVSYPESALKTKDIPYDPVSSCIGSQKDPVKRCEIGSDMPKFLVNPHEPVCMILDNRLQATAAELKYTFLPTNASGQAMAANAISASQTIKTSMLQPLSTALLFIFYYMVY